MRGNHRLGCYRQRVVERLVGNVGNIDDHAEPVHLPDHFAAKSVRPLCTGLSVQESAQLLFRKCDERHRANAEPIEHAEHAQIVRDRVAALDG